MQKGHSVAKLSSLSRSDAALTALTFDMQKLRLRKVMRSKETGAWLNIIPTVVIGMSLSKMESVKYSGEGYRQAGVLQQATVSGELLGAAEVSCTICCGYIWDAGGGGKGIY